MKISSVRLLSDGLKGIEVTYTKTSVKDGREFYDEYKRQHKAPVHGDLADLFKKISFHIANIFDASNTLVSTKGVKYNDKGIVLTGMLEIGAFENPKFTAINTPLITEEDGYEGYKNLVGLVGEIYKETELFMAGEKVMTDKQLVMQFYDSKKLEVDYAGMTNEEIKEQATKILEKMGSMVLHNEEINVEDIDVIPEINGTKQVDLVDAIEQVEEPDFIKLPADKVFTPYAVPEQPFVEFVAEETKSIEFDPADAAINITAENTFDQFQGLTDEKLLDKFEAPLFDAGVLIPQNTTIEPVKVSTAKRAVKME